MLYIGERVGTGDGPAMDVAVDPIDGTTLASKGGHGAISVVAAAERGSLFHTHIAYMDKIIVGPVGTTLFMASRIDMLMGIGGATEGVVTACAVRCLGGDMQGRLWLREGEEEIAKTEGIDPNAVLTLDDLCRSDLAIFAATGVTDGEFLQGVSYLRGSAYTQFAHRLVAHQHRPHHRVETRPQYRASLFDQRPRSGFRYGGSCMSAQSLETVAQAMVSPGRGILAAMKARERPTSGSRR